MRAADTVEDQQKARQADYDWPAIFRAIRKDQNMSQKSLAWTLKVSPQLLTDIKKARRPMPKEALSILKEKYSKRIIMKNQGIMA